MDFGNYYSGTTQLIPSLFEFNTYTSCMLYEFYLRVKHIFDSGILRSSTRITLLKIYSLVESIFHTPVAGTMPSWNLILKFTSMTRPKLQMFNRDLTMLWLQVLHHRKLVEHSTNFLTVYYWNNKNLKFLYSFSFYIGDHLQYPILR